MRKNIHLSLSLCMLALLSPAYAQENCNLEFPSNFYYTWQQTAWQPSYEFFSGATGSNMSAEQNRHVSFQSQSVDSASDGNLNALRLGSTNSLRLGAPEAYQYVSRLEYAAVLDGTNNILIFSYALVGSEFKDKGSNSQFEYSATITTPGPSSATTSISAATVSYSQLQFPGRQNMTTDHSNHTNARYNKWRTRVIDASSYPAGSIIRLFVRVNDDLSASQNDNQGRFMYAYLDVQCMGTGTRVEEPPLRLCSNEGYIFDHPLASNSSDEITHEWIFGDGSTSTSEHPVHIFPPSPVDSNGNYQPYEVKLKLTMPNGAGGTEVAYIPIKKFIVIRRLSGAITHNAECGKFNEFVFSHPATSVAGESWVWDFGDGSPVSTQASPHHIYGALGDFQVTLTFKNGDECRRTFFQQVNVHNCPLNCEDCITDFTLSPGEYIISAWVKEKTNDPLTTSYTAPSISVGVAGQSNQIFHTSGPIIDGWQRLEGAFQVNSDTSLVIKLNSGADTYFDDIRIFPFDGSMMSYVYDPVTLRLMAELDERNYAKLYEYDEEGKLIRVKKETENGIMTIQENIENSAGQ